MAGSVLYMPLICRVAAISSDKKLLFQRAFRYSLQWTSIRTWTCTLPLSIVIPHLNTVANTTISRWKRILKVMNIEHRVHGYILGEGTVLNMAGSLRYRWIKQLSYNSHFVQCMRTFYTVYLCNLQWLIRQYRVEKAVWKYCMLNIESMAIFWVQVQCCTWQDPCAIDGLKSSVSTCILCNVCAHIIKFPFLYYNGLFRRK